jgi:hypothetical protein
MTEPKTVALPLGQGPIYSKGYYHTKSLKTTANIKKEQNHHSVAMITPKTSVNFRQVCILLQTP